MVAIRWSIPAANLSEEGVSTILSYNRTKHRIYATGADAQVRAWREGDTVVIEGSADAPADQVKSFTRYMVASLLGGKELVTTD
ncbi:MAG: hypothetical protein U0556_15390 [Dehalococcoidia bacterium]